MEKQILHLYEAAVKAADAASLPTARSTGPEVSRCIDILKKLKSLTMTNELLAKTNISRLIRREFVCHRQDKIKSMAFYVLESWKKSSNDVPSQGSNISHKVSFTGKRNYLRDKVHIRSTVSQRSNGQKDCSRDKVRGILIEALSKVSVEIKDEKEKVRLCDPSRVGSLLESQMFMNLGYFDGSKKLKYRSIIFNLKDSRNPDLRRRVLFGEVSPERLIEMNSEEMANTTTMCEINRIKERLSSRQLEYV